MIIPHSNNYYKEINSTIANALGKSNYKNVIHQKEAYFEFFDKSRLETQYSANVNPGDVLIFRSDVFHCIPGNSTELHRDAIIASFSCSNTFFKYYSKNDSRKIDLKILDYPSIKFIHQSRLYNLPQKIEKTLIKTRKLVRSLVSSFHISSLKNFISETINNKSFQGLNIGSGPNFKCNNFIRLDVDDSVEKYGVRTKPLFDVNHDLSSSSPFPFKDSTFDCIYSSHTLEHLTLSSVTHVLNEAYRILKPGGIIRIVVPDFALYHQNYLNRNLQFFNWIRNKGVYFHDSWPRFIFREIAGQVVDNFSDDYLRNCLERKTSDQILNEFNSISDNYDRAESNIPDIHKSGYSEQIISDMLKSSKFKSISRCRRHNSGCLYMKNPSIFDNTRPNISLYMEAQK